MYQIINTIKYKHQINIGLNRLCWIHCLKEFLKLSNFICSINFSNLFRYKILKLPCIYNILLFCIYFLAKTSSQKDAVLDKETPKSALEEAIDLLVKCDAIVGKNCLYFLNILVLKITDLFILYLYN